MKLSVLHPTVRPAEALATIKRWRERAHDWDRVEYIVTADLDAKMAPGVWAEFNALENALECQLRLENSRPGYVYKLNKAATYATGEVLIEAHDDLMPPQDWDHLIEAELSAISSQPSTLSDRVLRVKHGGDRESTLCVPMILTRARYERYGFVTHPELVHLFADDYFTWLAERDGVITEAPHIAFSHEHPYFNRRPMDAVYQSIYAPEAWTEGSTIFERLKSAARPRLPWKEALQIHIAVVNRLELAAACLAYLVQRTVNAEIHVWFDDDHPDFAVFEKEMSAMDPSLVFHPGQHIGIEAQRVNHLRWFLDSCHQLSTQNSQPPHWLYFTDADAIHAEGWFETLRRLHLETGALVSGYRTAAHEANVTEDCGAYLRQKYVPGVSMLMSRAQVEQLRPLLGPEVRELTHENGGFDWAIPEALGHRCVVPAQSVVDHVGYGGMHHGLHEERGDRATHPVGDLEQRVGELWELARRI